MDRKTLIGELKVHLIEDLNLEEIRPSDIGDDTPLFGDGVHLDSIDALEIVVMIEKHYGVKIQNEEVGRKVLQNIESIADYILENEA